MNLNNVYLPHFCRPCYHKNNLMDLILLLIAHFVLIITFANAFVIKSSSSDAQLTKFHNNSTFMPSKSISYELTVIHNPINDYFNQTDKTNFKNYSLHNLDKINEEQLNQLNQVKFLNQLNKVNINPINVADSLNQIKQQQQMQSLKNQVFNSQKKQNEQSQQIEQQKNQLNEQSQQIEQQKNQLNEQSQQIEQQQSQLNEQSQQVEQQQPLDQTSIKSSIKQKPNEIKNEIRDGFVVLTSAHNNNYPAPMFSRNIFSNSGNDFYQKYYTTAAATIRPPVKEFHKPQDEQQIIVQNVEQNYQMTDVQQLQDHDTKTNYHQQEDNIKTIHSQQQNDVKTIYPQNYHNSKNNLMNNVFQPDDKPELENTDVIFDEPHKTLVNEFNSIKDENSDSKSFFELFGNGITSYNVKSNLTNSVNSFSDELKFENKTLLNSIDLNSTSTSTNSPFFDLMAEDSNYRPFVSNDNDNNNKDQQDHKLKAHGTRPGQPMTSYELFKEYPLINNSNIIINQFHSTPNWTKPESLYNDNQTKIFTITRKPAVNLPNDLTFLQPLIANYSSSFNTPEFRPTIITEFANDFLTNLTSTSSFSNNNNFDKNDLDNSDSISFFNLSSFTAIPNIISTTKSPIDLLDKNQFDIPLPPVWDSVANQLIPSTTLSPLSIFNSLPSNNIYNTQSIPFKQVSASELVTLKRNNTNNSLPKFQFKQPNAGFASTISPFNNNNGTLNSISSNNVPHHFHAFRLPSSTPSSVLYSATQKPIANTTFKYFNSFGSTTTPSTCGTCAPDVYKYIPAIATRTPPTTDHNYTLMTNNHNFEESIYYNNPLRLATNPKFIQPLTFLVMSYLASKSSLGANLITRNDQPSNSSASNGSGIVDWLRFSGRRNKKRSKQATRSNKQVSRQQKQRSANNNSNTKLNLNNLPIAIPNLQLRPITLEDILLSNQISNQLTGTSTLTQQSFPTSLSPFSNPLLYPSTRSPLLSTTSRMPQMIFETKRQRPSSNYIPEELLNDNEGYSIGDYEEEIKQLFENPFNELKLNGKLLNTINESKANKNSGSNSLYRTHRNSQQSNNINSRNSKTPPDSSGSSGSNINSPTSYPLLDNELNGISTNAPAPRCDKFTQDICVDDFEYPETAILEEIERKRSLFQILYSEVKGEVNQVDGLTRLQEQSLSWENKFGSNNYLNESSNESSSSSTNNSPNRNSYITMDDDILNNDRTAFRFSSLIKDQSHSSKSSGFICSSEILYGRPKLAKNAKNQWKVIVNAGKYTQTVRMEKCLQPNRACSFVQSAAAAIGATSKCAQVNAFHRLMVFEKGKGFYIDTFRIPSGCACYVQHKNKISSDNEFDSEELGSNNQYRKVNNRKRIDNPSSYVKDKSEVDGQISNRLQQSINFPTSIFNQPFILNDLNNLQRSKLQALFPNVGTFGQRVSNLNNANGISNTKLQPSVELRPLFLKNGKTLLASLMPLASNNNNEKQNSNNQSLIEKLSISGTLNQLNPTLAEQQQRELNQLILDLIKLNNNSPKMLNLDRSKIINLEDLIRSQLSIAQLTPNNFIDQLNSALFNINRQNINRRKNTSSSSKNINANLLNSLNNQKIGLLYLEDNNLNDKNLKTAKIQALPVVKLVQMPQLNNQLVYGQRFVDKRKSGIAQLLLGNKGNYSNLLTNNLVNNKNPLIVQRDNAFNFETPISALKIITPENLLTQSPLQENDSKEKNTKDNETSDESDDENEEKIIDEIDAGNLLGNMEDQEDKEDGEVNYAEMQNAESNHGESSEQENNTSKNDHNNYNERLSTNNELNGDDKEPLNSISNEDHDQANDLDDNNLKDQNLQSNHLDTNSSLFTFENISNGPKRKLKPKINNNNSTSYVSVSGFRNNLTSKNRFTTTTDSSNLDYGGSRSKYKDHEQYYTEPDLLQNEKNQILLKQNSVTSTTSSYLNDNNLNEWSGSLSSSTIFTPIQALSKHKYSSSNNNITTISPIYSTSQQQSNNIKRKQQNRDNILMFGRYKSKPLKTDTNLNNQLTNSAEQTSNQNIDRLAIEESENNLKNQTINLINKTSLTNDKSFSEILNEKINFHYHPIFDFINRKDQR